MELLPFLLAFALAGTAVAIWLGVRKSRRRRTLLSKSLPEEWRKILEQEFPRFVSMPAEIQKSVEGITQVLMSEKNFEPCGELEQVTDRMKLLISAQAALLLAKLEKHNYYGKLKSILVYPTAFRDGGHRRFGLHDEDESGTRLGESWQTGSVILSWESVISGAKNADDGMNVVIHEFAHQLDQNDGAGDGVPILHDRNAYRQWAKVFSKNYKELVSEVEDGKGNRSLIDPYGATNPAEFFAVASETFFEESTQLLREYPDLYQELKHYYQLDPAHWQTT
tara:strand:+ start:955 stop:1794 length:840 start_codon:yes stop_codon:yes gene_type:complete